MVIVVGADHEGFCLKTLVVEFLKKLKHEVNDLGTYNEDPVDYPDYTRAVSETILSKKAERGILICESVVGVCVAANKFTGIRAAICHDTYSARQSIADDNINILCLGSMVIGHELAKEIVNVWLSATFLMAERHNSRLSKVAELEKEFIVEIGH